MKHILKSNNFYLEIELNITEEELYYPVNTNMNIHIESDGFAGSTFLEIDIKEFSEFAICLYELYTSLAGTAKIKESYGYKPFLELSGDKKGNISIKGEISYINNNGCIQELRFENEFDQTYLKDFATEIYKTYGKHDNQ